MHPLTTDTLLADVVAADARALDRLAGLNPVFAVLLDPEHRNAMAGQIRLGEAAGRRTIPREWFDAVWRRTAVVRAARPLSRETA